jgi:hypothetical protein
LLAYFRSEMTSPQLRAEIQQRLQTDQRWQAHWDSIRHLDLERAAAQQDAEDLRRYLESLLGREQAARQAAAPGARRQRVEIEPFCRAVALSDGMILVPVVERRRATRAGDLFRWSEHLDECVYCRRMQRQVFARRDQEQLGEPLLRDWLLGRHYLPLLDRVTSTLVRLIVVCIVYPSEKGFTSVQVEDRREDLTALSSPRKGQWSGEPQWDWEARELAAPQAPGVRKGTVVTRSARPKESAAEPPARALPRVLEFSHALPADRGRLRIQFEITDKGHLLCECELSRSADEPAPLPEVTLEVLLNEQAFSKSGTERTLLLAVELEEGVPVAAAGTTQGIQVQVRQGDEVWDESAFQFRL